MRKYLALNVDKSSEMWIEINYRIQCGWLDWRKMGDMLCEMDVKASQLRGAET